MSYQKQTVAIDKRELSTRHFNYSRWAHSKIEPEGWDGMGRAARGSRSPEQMEAATRSAGAAALGVSFGLVRREGRKPTANWLRKSAPRRPSRMRGGCVQRGKVWMFQRRARRKPAATEEQNAGRRAERSHRRERGRRKTMDDNRSFVLPEKRASD